jgi:hypothetical protein
VLRDLRTISLRAGPLAGLGIAFRAKPKLQEVAHMSLNHQDRLDTLLYLMGYNGRDLREAEA